MLEWLSNIPDWILNLNVSRELIVIIIAVLPIFELRGALPVAINLFQMPWYWAFLLALIGNMLYVPIILLFLEYLIKFVSKVQMGKRLANWILERTRARSRIIQKYERTGLIISVAIPLPFTGAWTGAIAAFLFGMKFHHAFLAILCGVIVAGAIVTSFCLLGWIGAVIAGVGLCALTVLGWWKI